MKVLFIGNSHTFFNDMPNLFTDMVQQESGEPVDAVMLAYSGRDLHWHHQEYFSVRYNLLYGQYDYCIIQQAAHPFPDPCSTDANADWILQLCHTAHTKPVIYMTWAEQAHPEHARMMIDYYTGLAGRSGSLLAPVGHVFEALRNSHPEINLYWKDGEHASVYGDYLAASVLASTILQHPLTSMSCTGLDFLQDVPFDFAHPGLIEHPEKEVIPLDADTCAVILDAIAQIMVKH